MSAGSPNELQQFHDFLGQQLASGEMGESVEVAVQRFRRYQQELSDLRAKLRVAEQQSAAGQTGPFDAEKTKQTLRQRLAEDSKA